MAHIELAQHSEISQLIIKEFQKIGIILTICVQYIRILFH